METAEKKAKAESGTSTGPKDNSQDKLAVVLKSSTGRHRYLVRNSACLVLFLGALGALISSYIGISLTIRKLDPLAYEERVNEILSSTPLIDGHNDLPYLLRIELQNKIYDASEFQFWNGKVY
jgi:membrane dipeptidase